MDTGKTIAAISEWVDSGMRDRAPETVLWGRVSKCAEEVGEAVAALIGATGQNPRKGVTHAMYDVIEELLDVAVAALGAVEHIDGNRGRSIVLLEDKVARISMRAGLQRKGA